MQPFWNVVLAICCLKVYPSVIAAASHSRIAWMLSAPQKSGALAVMYGSPGLSAVTP